MFNKRVFIIFSFLIISTGMVFAIKPAETEWGIQYKTIPKNPGPGDYVFLDIYSYSTDLDSSNISYILNGEFKDGGTGKKRFTFKVPENNKEVKLHIVAKEFGGRIIEKDIIIKPVSVDLIYEVVDPYRPVFYKGKSVAISQSKLKFFAFPNFINSDGRKLDPKSLIYTWKLNGNILKNRSGLGKSKLLIDKIYGVPRETKVEVEVRNLGGGMIASKAIIIKPDFTTIDFYIDDKIMPFRFKSVAKPNLITNYLDSDIIAIPYFFNDLDKSNINWVINNNKINLLSKGDPLRINIIRNKENVASFLNIKLSIENDNRPLQSASERIRFSGSQELIDKFKREKQKRKIENYNGNTLFGL